MMNLAFQDRLEIGLEFPSGNLDIDAQGNIFAFLYFIEIRPDHLDLAVFDIVHLGHLGQFGALGFAAAHLAEQIGAPNAFTLVGRPE